MYKYLSVAVFLFLFPIISQAQSPREEGFEKMSPSEMEMQGDTNLSPERMETITSAMINESSVMDTEGEVQNEEVMLDSEENLLENLETKIFERRNNIGEQRQALQNMKSRWESYSPDKKREHFTAYRQQYPQMGGMFPMMGMSDRDDNNKSSQTFSHRSSEETMSKNSGYMKYQKYHETCHGISVGNTLFGFFLGKGFLEVFIIE